MLVFRVTPDKIEGAYVITQLSSSLLIVVDYKEFLFLSLVRRASEKKLAGKINQGRSKTGSQFSQNMFDKASRQTNEMFYDV